MFVLDNFKDMEQLNLDIMIQIRLLKRKISL